MRPTQTKTKIEDSRKQQTILSKCATPFLVFWRRVGTLSAFNSVTLNETLAPGVYDISIAASLAGTTILDAANLKTKFAAPLL
jgi:hypothetical protein